MTKIFKVSIKISIMERMPYGHLYKGAVFMIKLEMFKVKHTEGFY